MLVLKLELWSAITGERREIGRMYIANDGTGDRENGNYKIAINRRGVEDSPKGDWTTDNPTITRIGEVKNHKRLAQNVWRLVLKGLKSAFPEEK